MLENNLSYDKIVLLDIAIIWKLINRVTSEFWKLKTMMRFWKRTKTCRNHKIKTESSCVFLASSVFFFFVVVVVVVLVFGFCFGLVWFFWYNVECTTYHKHNWHGVEMVQTQMVCSPLEGNRARGTGVEGHWSGMVLKNRHPENASIVSLRQKQFNNH